MGAIGEGALREKRLHTVKGDTPPHKCCLDPASLEHSSAIGAAVSLEAESAGPRPASVGTPWLWREDGLARDPPFQTPSSWGLALKHSQALCGVTRGRRGGTTPARPPGLELVSQASVFVSGFERLSGKC